MIVQNSQNRVNFFFGPPRDAQYSEMDFALNLTISRFLAFELRLIVYSTFVVNCGLRRIQKKKIYQGVALSSTPPPGAPLPGPGCFGLNPPSQLVIEYHWLAFLILNDHISKTKISVYHFPFDSEHCATFWTKNTSQPLLRRVGGLHVINQERANNLNIVSLRELTDSLTIRITTNNKNNLIV